MSWIYDEDVRHYIKIIGAVMIFCIIIIGVLMFMFKPDAKIELKTNIVEFGDDITSIDLIRKVKGKNIESGIQSKGSLTFPDLEITADELDTTKLGVQNITYSFSDGSEDVVEEIEVKDTIKPVIKLKNERIELKLSEFKKMKSWKKYYEVSDNYFEAPTSTESLDKKNVDYGDILHLDIIAIDVSGNKSTARMIIKIKEKEKPEDKQNENREEKESTQHKETIPNQIQNSEKETTYSDRNPNEYLPRTENKSKLAGKKYLFSEGWDMSSAPNQCQIDLRNSNASGSCIPIQDANGIYLGMELVFY